MNQWGEGDITYYDADTDKELEQYKRLIENEELAHRVTISTKVLDVGVNIKTENVNVVVFDDDPIEIKQMVGRKRVKPDEDEKVLVYFHVPTIKELNKRKGCAENDLAEYQKTNEEYQRGIYASIKSPLYIMDEKIHINYYYKVKTNYDFYRYDELIDEMSKVESNQAKYVYADYILQQFHFKVSEIEKYFCSYEPKGEIAVKLRKCLSPYLDQKITKEELNDLAERLLKILPDPRTDNSYRTLRVPEAILEQVQERKKEVEEQKKKLGKDYFDRNYVSCSGNGLPHSTSAFNNALTKLCKRNGFPHLTVHSLRHMYASILLEQGVPLVKISALLGHSSIHTTFEFYCETMNDEASIRDFMNMKFVPGGEA